MRLTTATRFPHPVLSAETNDFIAGDFDVRFSVEEHRSSGTLVLRHVIELTEPAVRQLVESGLARLGCFVRCADTYLAILQPLSWPSGQTEFVSGMLLNRVELQPMIWLDQPLDNWDPGTIHEEFQPPVALARGDVIALGAETILSVGQAKFAPLESIFELRSSDNVAAGMIKVDPDGDRIGILAGHELFATIELLRGQRQGQPIVMNSVYLPAVMDMLECLGTDGSQYESRRWYVPFMAKCDALDIVPSGGKSVLECAQRLLQEPLQSLHLLTGGDSNV